MALTSSYQEMQSILVKCVQQEEDAAKKLYSEFVESFGDEPEQKAPQRSFTRGETIQPGSSASSAGKAPCCPPLPSFLVVLSNSLCRAVLCHHAGTASILRHFQGFLEIADKFLALQDQDRRRLANMFHLFCHLIWRPP